MTIQELIEFINPLDTSKYQSDTVVGPLVQDSRQVTDGSVFIAIRGHEVDGHAFMEDAIYRGAKVVICEESFYSDEDVCIIEVENTRSLIGPLAHKMAGNPANQLKVVGITGTNGKTTTATLVYQILMECGYKASLLGTVAKKILDETIDSKLTTSDPIELASDMRAMVDAGSQYLVMEVSSHALHQERVNGFSFDIGVFTNLSQDHLDYHNNIEEYAAAKKLLFDRLPADGTAIVNVDDAYGKRMIAQCDAQLIKFSFEEEENAILSNTAEGLKLTVHGQELSSSLSGNFNAYNIAQAYLVCEALGLDSAVIADALTKVDGAPGRMENVTLEGGKDKLPTVIVDYAHTPDALENVLTTLKSLKENANQKLICVFGAGGDRDTSKRPKMAQAAEQFADLVIVTSDNPRTENPDVIIADILQGFESTENVSSITSRDEAINHAIQTANASDIVLIAGKGHENYQEINGERHHFDDREVAREALTAKLGGLN